MRSRFDHLFVELSVRLGRLAPRYPLWLRFHEIGLDPGGVSREQMVAFCRDELADFLRENGLSLPQRAARGLERAVARHNPLVPSPEDWVTRTVW